MIFSENRFPLFRIMLGRAGGREAPALFGRRAGQRLYIVPDQFNVSGGVALFVRQAVGIERSADASAGFRGYPLNEPGVADIFKKNSWNFCSPDLDDNPRYIARAGLGFGGNAQGSDEVDAIGGGEITERFMG